MLSIWAQPTRVWSSQLMCEDLDKGEAQNQMPDNTRSSGNEGRTTRCATGFQWCSASHSVLSGTGVSGKMEPVVRKPSSRHFLASECRTGCLDRVEFHKSGTAKAGTHVRTPEVYKGFNTHDSVFFQTRYCLWRSKILFQPEN